MTKRPAKQKPSAPRRRIPAYAGRCVLAGASSGLTSACLLAGLASYFAPLQAGVAGGVAAALVAPSTRWAAAAGLAGVLLGGALVPGDPWMASETAWYLQVAGAGAVAAALAAAVHFGLGKRHGLAGPVLYAVVALLVVNLWVTVLSVNGVTTFDPTTGEDAPSFDAQLASGLAPAVAASDDAWFFRVYQDVDAGRPFYAAFLDALEGNPRWEPASVADFRMPTLFWLWSALPGPSAVVVAFLSLVSVAVVATLPLNAGTVRLPLALPAAAAVAGYFLFFPVQISLFSQEAWAGALGICALSASALSFRSERMKTWTIVAVSLAVLGVLVRETLVFVPLAGLASVLLAERTERKFRAIAWGAGLVAIAVAYAAHVAATARLVVPNEAFTRMGKGSVAFALAAFEYGTDFLGYGGGLPVVLAALGLIGAALMRPRAQSAMVLASTVLPLASFLLLGNRAWYETTGESLNYWGATVLPLLLAVVPSAFALVPGAVSRAADGRLT